MTYPLYFLKGDPKTGDIGLYKVFSKSQERCFWKWVLIRMWGPKEKIDPTEFNKLCQRS